MNKYQIKFMNYFYNIAIKSLRSLEPGGFISSESIKDLSICYDYTVLINIHEEKETIKILSSKHGHKPSKIKATIIKMSKKDVF